MTPQESTMLNDLVRKIQQTQLPEKDDEAEKFLQDSLGRNPDALYILTQSVLVQNIALDQAKAQMQQLQQQVQDARSQVGAALPPPAQPAHATSFLGGLFGRHDSPQAPPPPPQSFPPRPAAAPQYYPPPPAYAPDYAAAPPAAPPPSGGSSFLRSAATTAAGVAAGALAFEGVESLIHGFGHSGGGGFGSEGFGGGGFGGGGFNQRPEETVINNYYDDPNQGVGERREASFDDRSGGFGNDRGSDDRFGDDRGAQLNDASYQSADARNSLDNIDTLDDDQTTGGIDDDSSYDDSSNFDDGGSDDTNV
jgi:uncharacterized protein